MKSNTLKKIIFSSVVVLVLLVVNIVFLIFTNNAVARIGELKKEVYKESALISDINETKRKTEDLNNIKEEINSLLIEESEVVSFIGFVEDISATNNLEININKVDFREPKKENELGTLEMSFKITGSWTEVTNFIKAIETVSYLVNVESIRLSAFNNNGDVGWGADFILKGFTK